MFLISRMKSETRFSRRYKKGPLVGRFYAICGNVTQVCRTHFTFCSLRSHWYKGILIENQTRTYWSRRPRRLCRCRRRRRPLLSMQLPSWCRQSRQPKAYIRKSLVEGKVALIQQTLRLTLHCLKHRYIIYKLHTSAEFSGFWSPLLVVAASIEDGSPPAAGVRANGDSKSPFKCAGIFRSLLGLRQDISWALGQHPT